MIYDLDRIEAVWKKLGGDEGVNRLLRNELTITVKKPRQWYEQDGVIYFLLTSNGMMGREWIRRLVSKGIIITRCAKSILLSSDFKPTKDIPYKIAVIKGGAFSKEDRVRSKIISKVLSRNMIEPSAEIACLIRDAFTDEEIKEMGLSWIVTMHEPVRDSDGGLGILSTHACASKLGVFYGGGWHASHGFAFLAPL